MFMSDTEKLQELLRRFERLLLDFIRLDDDINELLDKRTENGSDNL